MQELWRAAAKFVVVKSLERGAKVEGARRRGPEELDDQLDRRQESGGRQDTPPFSFVSGRRIRIGREPARSRVVEQIPHTLIGRPAVLGHLDHVHDREHQRAAGREGLPEVGPHRGVGRDFPDRAVVQVDQRRPNRKLYPSVGQARKHDPDATPAPRHGEPDPAEWLRFGYAPPSSCWTSDRFLLDSAPVARPDLVTGPVFKFTSDRTKDEEPPSDT